MIFIVNHLHLSDIQWFPMSQRSFENIIYTTAVIAHCFTSVGQSGYLWRASFICIGSTNKVTSLYSLGVFLAKLSNDFTNSKAVKCSNAWGKEHNNYLSIK